MQIKEDDGLSMAMASSRGTKLWQLLLEEFRRCLLPGSKFKCDQLVKTSPEKECMPDISSKDLVEDGSEDNGGVMRLETGSNTSQF